MVVLNVWGTDKSLIDDDEFCLDCEHSIYGHYTNCPTLEPDYWASFEDRNH